MLYNFVADSILTKKLRSRLFCAVYKYSYLLTYLLSSSEVQFFYGKRPFCDFAPFDKSLFYIFSRPTEMTCDNKTSVQNEC